MARARLLRRRRARREQRAGDDGARRRRARRRRPDGGSEDPSAEEPLGGRMASNVNERALAGGGDFGALRYLDDIYASLHIYARKTATG